jgi:hypothetical protein
MKNNNDYWDWGIKKDCHPEVSLSFLRAVSEQQSLKCRYVYPMKKSNTSCAVRIRKNIVSG